MTVHHDVLVVPVLDLQEVAEEGVGREGRHEALTVQLVAAVEIVDKALPLGLQPLDQAVQRLCVR